MELYTWQKEAVDAWQRNHNKGIFHVITGAGKTAAALHACEVLFEQSEKVNVRVIVPTKALASQWKKAVMSYFPVMDGREVGIYSSEVKTDPGRRFVIYVVNSARYSVSRHILKGMQDGYHQFLICDECHRYTGLSNRLIFDFLKYGEFKKEFYHCLGLSATPYCREFESVLVPALGKVVYQFGIDEAAGLIAPFVVLHVSVPFTGEEITEYAALERHIHTVWKKLIEQDQYLNTLSLPELFQLLSERALDGDEDAETYCGLIRKRRELIMHGSQRLFCVTEILKKRRTGEKTIIFCERIDQAEEMYRVLKELFPNIAAHYHSKMSREEKKFNLDQFRYSDREILVTCKALDEGLDVPDAAAAIVVSSTSMERQRLQRLGRILRRKEDGRSAVLYYLFIEGTVEADTYLEDAENVSVQEMRFLGGSGFVCEIYEKAALRALKKEKLSVKAEAEFRRCLEEGNGRADWLLDEAVLKQLRGHAETVRERNYFMAMLKVHREL